MSTENPSNLFVDSSAFITLADQGEERHGSARNFAAEIPSTVKLVTTNFILDETITRVRTLLGVEAACKLGREILSSKKYEVIFIDEETCLRALEKMKKFADKEISFTDCTSFVVMEQRRLREAFAFDEDFTRAGFRVRP